MQRCKEVNKTKDEVIFVNQCDISNDLHADVCWWKVNAIFFLPYA